MHYQEFNERTSLDGQKKAEMVKKLHESVWYTLKRKMSNKQTKLKRVVDKSSLD